MYGDKSTILMITVKPLFPNNNNGYTVRMFNFLKKLKQDGYKIVLVSLMNSKISLNIDELDEICNEFIPIYYNKILAYFNLIKALFRVTSFKSEYYNMPKVKKIIKNVFNEHKIDYVCGYLYSTYHFLDLFPNTVRWIDLCDSISMLHKRHYKSTKNIFKKLFYLCENCYVEKIEKHCINNYDLVTLISEIDIKYLAEEDNSKVKLLSNGVCIPKLSSVEYNKNEIVYLGDMSYIQNHDAVIYFITEILPKLIEKNPEIKFKIVGRNVKKEIYALCQNNKNVIITGEVDDINKELITAACMVCPIRISSGVQNKVLESMALGVPVIATPNVANPISKDASIIMQAQSPEEWVNAINKICDDTNERMKRGILSRNLMIEKFSWEREVNKLEKYLNK